MITREQSSAMRGIAILGIVLHNYTHWLAPMVKENEYTFTQHNVDRLIYELQSPSMDILAHLLSFFGHYGVPVFLFLSAYGLVKKYESPTPTLSRSPTPTLPRREGGANSSSFNSLPTGEGWGGAFFWSHYKKLFLMMIVGYVAFVMVDYMTPRPRHYELWNVVGELGMFSNLYAEPNAAIWPGPYWYFGLMVQIYIVYRFVLYKGKGSLCGISRLTTGYANYIAIILALFFTIQQVMMDPEGGSLNWYRYNFMGGMLPFVAGLVYARSKTNNPELPRWAYALLALLFTVIIFGGSLSFGTWIWVPLAVPFAILFAIKAIPQQMLRPLVWVGGISAAMFVSHPIARKVIIPISQRGDVYAGLLLYLAAALVLGILFKKLISIIKAG